MDYTDTAARRRCTGVVLAGGLATRTQGAAKGLWIVEGVPIVERAAAALRGVTDALLLSIGDRDVPSALPGVARVRDAVPSAGPLAGIHAALRASGGDVIVCAWDMPFVEPALLAELRRAGEQGYDAVIPAGDHGYPEPLCAWYSHSVLPAVERRLASSASGNIVAALAGCTLHIFPTAAVRHFGDPHTMFLSVNTSRDLDHASERRRLGAAPS